MAGFARKVLKGAGLVILLIVLAIGLGTLVPRPIVFSRPAEATTRPDEHNRRILILSNPIHTDIALPADPDVLERFGFVSRAGLELDYPGVEWIVFGWGSRSFYIETPTWAELKAGPVIDALTWDRSVMHVTRVGNIPLPQDSVRALDLSADAFDVLTARMAESFQTGADGEAREIVGSGYGAHDIFLPAYGGFNALLGCNTWTARMLRSANLKTGVWTPLPFTLIWSLDLHNRL